MNEKNIAGYQIEHQLGEGGMGVVYRAIDPTLHRAVALKVIRSGQLGHESKERFLREARACSRINHPNIVTVYAAGEEDGRPYLAMEFLEGQTLRDIIDQGPTPHKKAVEWLKALLAALQRLHDEGIIHRDIKPENIFITKDNILKLMDFGIARVSDTTTISDEGTTLGTVYYMSPEQAVGKPVDARSDLFAVATVFYEMITGIRPFEGEHPMAVMYSITNSDPAPMPVELKIPDHIESAVRKALQKNVEDRFDDVGQFAAALDGAPTEDAPTTRKGIRVSVPVVAAGVVIVVLLAMLPWLRGQFSSNNDSVMAERYQASADSLADMGLNTLAREAYRKAIDADPRFALAYGNLAIIEKESETTVGLLAADSLLEIALDLQPGHAPFLRNHGSVKWDLNDLDGAARLYEEALAADSTLLSAYNDYAALLIEKNEHERAVPLLQSALRLARALAPGDQLSYVPNLLKHRGRAALAMGNSEQAGRDWQEAIAMDPNFQEVHGYLADWYEQNGDSERAQFHRIRSRTRP